MKTFGRHTLYANYTEKDFLSKSEEEQKQILISILGDSNFQLLHQQNANETNYLIDYMYGDQDIKYKDKKTRVDINHTSVENWAYAFVDWKNTFLLGKPVQYAPANDSSNEEIVTLNNYMTYENKNKKNLELWEEVLACGRGFIYVSPSDVNNEDEAPFDITKLEPDKTEVVYSSGIKKEPLFGFVQTRMSSYQELYNEVTGEKEYVEMPYNEYTIYTRSKQFVLNDKNGDWQVTEVQPLIHNEHRVIEFALNKKREGIVEIGMDIFNDINYVENLDLDDIEGFVNSIMVFTNAQVDKKGMDQIKEFGAVSIKSTEQKKASVELLQSRLKSLDTEIYYLRKINALHNILGVPQATNNGQMTAETGKAFLTGQGFTSASVRIQKDELAFIDGEKKVLKIVLKICKENANSNIKNLKVSDINIKLSRDLSDNLLLKSQSLLTLMNAGIPPEIRNQVVNLFSDPALVTALQKKFEEEQQQIQQELNSREINKSQQDLQEQNNSVEDVLNVQEQEQG